MAENTAPVTPTAAPKSGVAGLVNSMVNAKPGEKAGKPARKKFVIYLDGDVPNQLTTLSQVTRTGKIDLASQLFAIAVQDGINQCIAVGKLDAKGNLIEEKKAPAAPATPASAPK